MDINNKYNLDLEINVEDKKIGKNNPCFIIAEAGISHFGDLKKAYQLVDLACEAKADAVKFQIFDVDHLISDDLLEWKERLGPRQLPYKDFEKIKNYCKSKNIIFFATAHDSPSLEFLINLNVPIYKIGSGELGNWQFIRKIASLQKPVILSTGMYKDSEIKLAVDQFNLEKNSKLAILHCVTNYPASPSEIYIKQMHAINKKFNCITGYSDHTEGYHIPLAAVALGSKIIEKHITLDYNIPNAQDWKVSCGPENFHTFVKQVRDVEEILKQKEIEINKSELKSKHWATKSIVAGRNIKKGEFLSDEMISFMRPGNGIPPDKTETLLGKKVLINIPKNKMLKYEYFKSE